MTFNLDAWKREFSNSIDPETSIKWLIDNFNHHTHGIRQAEITGLNGSMKFIRANTINGYFQQLDGKLHKTAFGVAIINPQDPTTATCLWLFKFSDPVAGADNKTDLEEKVDHEMIPSEMVDSALDGACENSWKIVGTEQLESLSRSYFFPPPDSESYVFK